MQNCSEDIDKLDNNTFTCFRCGVCCRKFQVRLNRDEAERIAGKLKMSRAEFLNTYIDRRWPGITSYLIRQINGACAFLKQDGKNQPATCLIHPFRPSSCRDWLAGPDKPECQEGLENMTGQPENCR